MNYNDRLRLITAALNDFLRRYRRPEHLDEHTMLAELRSMAEAINRRISGSSSPDDLVARVDQAIQHVTERYRGREWPKPADFATAMDATRKPAEKTGLDYMEWARKLWFEGGEGCPPKTCISPANTWEIAQKLIQQGADPWELRYAGFETDTEFYRDLEAQGKGWHGHERKMAEIRCMTARFKEAAE